MLKHEIEPFADAHMAELDRIRKEITNLFDTEENLTDAQRKTILGWSDALANTRSGIYRFRQCALDEWRQKERLEQKLGPMNVFNKK